MEENIINVIYDVAVAVYEGKLEKKHAVSFYLGEKVNHASVYMYINNYKCMREGKAYSRAMNASITRCFLNKILQEHKKAGLEKALSALDKHIVYYNSLGRGKHNLLNASNEF
jgi:5-methylcytosine-specific restriction enzyme A